MCDNLPYLPSELLPRKRWYCDITQLIDPRCTDSKNTYETDACAHRTEKKEFLRVTSDPLAHACVHHMLMCLVSVIW